MKSKVVSEATISTTNMTGFLISRRGSSLAKAAPTAGHTIFGSNSAEPDFTLRRFILFIDFDSEEFRSEQGAAGHRQVFDDGAKGECREEGQSTDDQDDADDQADEQASGCRKGSCRRWD